MNYACLKIILAYFCGSQVPSFMEWIRFFYLIENNNMHYHVMQDVFVGGDISIKKIGAQTLPSI